MSLGDVEVEACRVLKTYLEFSMNERHCKAVGVLHQDIHLRLGFGVIEEPHSKEAEVGQITDTNP